MVLTICVDNVKREINMRRLVRSKPKPIVSDKEWQQERATEAGMLHGIDAYNDVMGYTTYDLNDPRNMPSPNEIEEPYWEDE